MSDLAETYLATWNETDPAARRILINELWAEDISYTDPMASVAGQDGLDSVIAAVHEQFPGFVFSALGQVDAHHQQARFRWGLGPSGDQPIIEGFDVVTINDQGQFSSVLGFLDKVPTAD